jgi:hypothetical protein
MRRVPVERRESRQLREAERDANGIGLRALHRLDRDVHVVAQNDPAADDDAFDLAVGPKDEAPDSTDLVVARDDLRAGSDLETRVHRGSASICHRSILF